MLFYPIILHNQERFQVEENCYTHSFSYNAETPVQEIVDEIWNHTLFLGELVLEDELRQRIHDASIVVFKKLFDSISIREKMLLIYECVLLTQEQDQENLDGKLWDYILLHLDYDKIYGKRYSPQTVRKALVEILLPTLCAKKKIYSSEGHKFYNTLRIHALSPILSLEHLFHILYHFYEKNLEYQYIEGDSSYSIFVKQIAKRWQFDADNREELKLPCDTLAASFRVLFISYPNCMAAICDSLVYRLDMLLRGNEDELCENQRWDQQLLEWFHKHTQQERHTMERSVRNASRERVVTRTEDICPAYDLKDESLLLLLPRMRLPEITERPILTLFQGNTVLLSKPLSVFGDELCLTTREVTFQLDKLELLEWDKKLSLRIVIECGGKQIYDSCQMMYREYILFRESGEEVKKIKTTLGRMFLLTGKETPVFLKDQNDDYQCYTAFGKLYDFYPSTLQMLIVNGQKLIHEESGTASAFLSETPVKGAVMVCQGKQYLVFRKTTILNVAASEREQLKHYYYKHEEAVQQIYPYSTAEAYGLAKIPLSEEPNKPHHMEIVDFSDQRVIYELDYCIIPDFSYTFQPKLFPARHSEGSCELQIAGKRHSISLDIDGKQESVSIPLFREPGANLEVMLPKVQAYLNNRNAFALPEYLWHGELSDAQFLTVLCPKEYHVRAFLGAKSLPVSRHQFDIGGTLRNMNEMNLNIVRLGIQICEGNEVVMECALTDVVLCPMMSDTPIIQEGRKLIWFPENVFIGPDKAEFRLVLETDTDESWEYQLSRKASIIESHFPCREGTYHYTVFMCGKQKAFVKEPDVEIFEGTIMVEDPEETRFQNRCIHLLQVDYGIKNWWTKDTAMLRKDNGWLLEIQYQGSSVPYNGKLSAYQEPLPEYTAYLQFRHPDGRWIDYNYNDNPMYYLTNPVRFWTAKRSDDVPVLLIEGKDGKRLRLLLNCNKSGCAMIQNRVMEPSNQEQLKYADRFTYAIENL